MTGKELIIYILKHNLENEELSLNKMFLTEAQKAVSLGTGIATVRAMYDLGYSEGFKIGDSIYFLMEDQSPNGLH